MMVAIVSALLLYFNSTYTWDYQDDQYVLKAGALTYDLRQPKARWDLPRELEEISGLSYYKKNELACVQDEDGDLFIYDLKKSEISRREQFGERGDYEGVEVVDDTVYVLKSNGNVYFFPIKAKSIGQVSRLKTDLSSANDTEGLGYFDVKEEVLIACKDKPGTKKVDIEKSRTIYCITRADKKFKKKPRFIIDGKSYKKMLEQKGLSKKKHSPFMPSGVAVHPITKDIYVIGTVGKMLIIMNPEGEITNLIPLDPKIHWQPEGICFDPDGNLYISSEGRGKKGYILQF